MGSLLFSIFINDLSEWIHCKKLLFGFDKRIFIRVGSISDCKFLQRQINRLCNWCSLNYFNLNVFKCKIVIQVSRQTENDRILPCTVYKTQFQLVSLSRRRLT